MTDIGNLVEIPIQRLDTDLLDTEVRDAGFKFVDQQDGHEFVAEVVADPDPRHKGRVILANFEALDTSDGSTKPLGEGLLRILSSSPGGVSIAHDGSPLIKHGGAVVFNEAIVHSTLVIERQRYRRHGQNTFIINLDRMFALRTA